jgi:hypothetical protein
MTRRTTSRAPGMFPGRQPSSHPNPCLGGVCSRYAGSERTLRRSRIVQNDGCQAGSRNGFEPQGGTLAPNTHDGLETRQSEARRRRGGSGPQTRRRRGFHNAARVRQRAADPTTRRGSHNAARIPQRAADPTTRRGSHNAPRIPQRAASTSQTPRAVGRRPARRLSPETRRGADLTACRWHVPPYARAVSRRPARRLSPKRGQARVSRHASGVYPHIPRAAAARTRRRAGTTVAPGLGTRQRLAQRYLPSGTLAL